MKTNIIICGAAGRMGKMLTALVANEPQTRLVGAVESPSNDHLGSDAGELAGVAHLGVTLSDEYKPDSQSVTLDFTSPQATLDHLAAAAAAGAAIVIGTTGFSPDERRQLEDLAARTRAVLAPNMSVGINVLLKLVATAATALSSGFDIEIMEMHHHHKVDAPSGTALALGRAAAEASGRDFDQVACFSRHGMVGPREKNEIGIVALRGGDTVGDHTVLFVGGGERLELTHRAQSRECLARGALTAALWLSHQPKGIYSMADVLGIGD